MDRTEISKKVMKIVCDHFGADSDEITETTSFVNDLNADSLDAVEIVMEIEDEFNITIKDDEMNDFFTVRSLLNFLEKSLNEDKSS